MNSVLNGNGCIVVLQRLVELLWAASSVRHFVEQVERLPRKKAVRPLSIGRVGENCEGPSKWVVNHKLEKNWRKK